MIANFPQDLLKLTYDETKAFTIKDRGDVIPVELAANGYDVNVNRKQLNETFMGKLVMYKNAVYIIKGIESHAAMNVPHTTVGLLLKKWGLWHQIEKKRERDTSDEPQIQETNG